MNLLSLLLLSLGVVNASPLTRDTGKATLKLFTQFNTAGTKTLIEKDRARFQSLVTASSGGTSGNSLSTVDVGTLYLTEVGVGTPPTNRLLLVDTGSSNLWIGANSTYTVTESSVNTGNAISVSYGSGAFSGEEWLDTVTLTPELVVTNQSLGVASWTEGIDGMFDGILGIGPIDLTQDTVNDTYEVPTITDTLFAQKKISKDYVGIFFAPYNSPSNSGTLTFGGYDDSVLASQVNYVPVTEGTASSSFWGISQTVSYGSTTIMSTTDGFVDTGTTLIYIPSDAYQKYQSLSNATVDPATGLLSVTSAQYDKLQTLCFHIGSTSYGLTPDGQIWPRSLNYLLGGSSNAIYLVVSDNGPSSSEYPNFINGFTFLQRFYSVFDTTNQQVGFAETIYTNSETNSETNSS